MDSILELELDGSRDAGGYTVRVLRATGGGEPTGQLSLDVPALLAERAYVETSVLASAVPARRVVPKVEAPVRSMGRRLFEALFTGAVGGTYRAALSAARQRGHGLQLILRLRSPELAVLPWESLFDPETETYVCLKEPLVRHVPAPYTADPLPFEPPLRVLAMVSSPRGLPPLDVDGEQERLEQALRAQTASGLVALEWLRDASWESLHEILLANEWHVLHFIGHGDFDEVADEGVLALTGRDGRADLVDSGRLADLLDEAEPTPRLVVLNSCLSGASGGRDIFAGTAATLARSGIPAVAAMQFAVSDDGALAFSRGFYTALSYGRTVDEAVRSGRIGMLGTSRGTLEWITPVLYVRGGVTQLFDVHPARRTVDPAAGGDPDPVELGSTTGDDGAEPDAPWAAPPTEAQRPPASTAPHADGSALPARRGRRRGLVAGAVAVAVVGGGVAYGVWSAVQPGAEESQRPPAAEPTPRAEEPVALDVPADVAWTDTGVLCEEGYELMISATGAVMHEQTPNGAVSPDGLTDPLYHQWNVPGLPEANTVALIGSIGDGAPFVVGSTLVYPCDAEGELALGVNDIGLEGNSGAFQVEVTRRPQA